MKETLMSHEPFRDQLVALAATTAQDPTGFLDGLSPIHDDWHTTSPRGYGFLLFHARVVRSFKTIVLPNINPPIQAFTEQDFRDMRATPFKYDVASVNTLAELVTFSTALESWHNGAHAGIETATGAPMMDPRQNIFFRAFWRLHFFIDDLFATTLEQYGNAAHRGEFVTPAAVASHLEARHHGWVSRI
jgi:hypothetical protein